MKYDEKNPHIDHRERMRQRIREKGFDSLLDHELLEYLLYFALPRGDTNPIAHRLMREFGSFSRVLDADYEALVQVPGVGPRTAELIQSYAPVFRRYAMGRMGASVKLNTCDRSAAYAHSLFIGAKREQLYLLCLDVQCDLICPVLLSEGTVDEAVLYPRNLVEQTLRAGAKHVILAHNHLSRNFLPSSGDIRLTQKVLSTLSAIEVDLLDHVIISESGYYSFVQDGKIPHQVSHGHVLYAAEREL